MEHLKQETASGAQLNMDALYQICPQCFTESKDPKTGEVKHAVDFEKLRLLLGDNVAEGDERYDFTWVGKRAALQEAAKPIRKTLRPYPEESVDWENTKNLYIEGDNLEVLKLLQNSYMGKVKMIYIDPPYNTGNDFVYQDDFHQTKQDYDFFSGDVTEEGERLVKNTESNGRFHSDWCSMIYSRLMVARNLLKEDGVIFISIDDNEVENLRRICNEVFGEYNFIANLIWQKKFSRANDAMYFSTMHDHIICVAKNNLAKDEKGWKIGLLPRGDELPSGYGNPDNDPRGPWTSVILSAKSGSPSLIYEITTPSGRKCLPPSGRYWSCSKDTFEKWRSDNRIWFGSDGDGTPRKKTFLSEVQAGLRPNTILFQDEVGNNQEAKQETKALFDGLGVFDGPKPVRLLYTLGIIANLDKNDIVVDFFSGSATTAHAVMQLNAEDGGTRKFIMVQWPEECDEESEAFKAGYKNICDIGKERIRRAGKIILEEQKAKKGDLFSGDQKPLDVGFRVFKCADSNMKDVYYTPAEYSQELLLGLEDNIKEDRNDLDLLFGCMLDWGVTLDLPLRTEKVDGVTIHIVNDGDLVACFDQNIPESAIDHIASLLPMRVVLRDSCFKEAKEKMNFFEIFKQRTGWSEEEVKKNVKVI
ncbi:MAG: site-specific DNA-methyltransferase [Bacteroidaceae bacterium]|nr:site-specific DNA-methyltransferase [Bacteroidaceae bacterium]